MPRPSCQHSLQLVPSTFSIAYSTHFHGRAECSVERMQGSEALLQGSRG